MSNRHNSVKNLPRSMKCSQKRVSPLNQSIKIILDSSASARKASTPTSVANRLIQKKASTERKIEILRQKKLEDEMKEVQSKPTILNKSRKLAKKAEKKYLADEFRPGNVEENAEKLKVKSQSQNRISVIKAESKKVNSKQIERKVQGRKSESAVRTVKSQKIQIPKKNFIKKVEESSKSPCNDTFDLEEEILMIENRLGIQARSGLNAEKLNEKEIENKSFVFAQNSRTNQRLNFKHKFKIREIPNV